MTVYEVRIDNQESDQPVTVRLLNGETTVFLYRLMPHEFMRQHINTDAPAFAERYRPELGLRLDNAPEGSWLTPEPERTPSSGPEQP